MILGINSFGQLAGLHELYLGLWYANITLWLWSLPTMQETFAQVCCPPSWELVCKADCWFWIQLYNRFHHEKIKFLVICPSSSIVVHSDSVLHWLIVTKYSFNFWHIFCKIILDIFVLFFYIWFVKLKMRREQRTCSGTPSSNKSHLYTALVLSAPQAMAGFDKQNYLEEHPLSKNDYCQGLIHFCQG